MAKRELKGGLDEAEKPLETQVENDPNQFAKWSEYCEAEFGVRCHIEPDDLKAIEKDSGTDYVNVLTKRFGDLESDDVFTMGFTSHRPTVKAQPRMELSVMHRSRRRSMPFDVWPTPEEYCTFYDSCVAVNGAVNVKRPPVAPPSVIAEWERLGHPPSEIKLLIAGWLASNKGASA